MMRTLTAAGAVLAAAAGLAAPTARAATLCVDLHRGGCFRAIQHAVDASHDGDRITIGPGAYAGGIAIDASIELVGRSAAATIIRGGGPVLTIGVDGGVAPPTVSISGVTLTGGRNDSVPDRFVTAGGGILIPPAAGHATGATVTLVDSVVAANRVTPQAVLPPGPPCGPFTCAFALGAGIDNAGILTVEDTRISGNVAGSTPGEASVASHAVGGGILNHRQGELTVRRSVVSGNRAAVDPPHGRFAESGGIGNDGVLTIEDSVVDGNSVEASSAVASAFPFDVQQEAVGGGIRISDTPGATGTIVRTSVSGNSVHASNLAGDVQAVAGGLDVDGSLLLVDSRVDRNRVVAVVPPASGFLAGAVFGGFEISGDATIRGSSVSGNVLEATSATGAANVAGAGLANLSGHVSLERTRVIGNRGVAHGVAGLVVGGGILNAAFGGGPPELSMIDGVVTANALTATPGIEPRGGGIFTADLFTGEPFPVALSGTVIAGNEPDQCVGC